MPVGLTYLLFIASSCLYLYPWTWKAARVMRERKGEGLHPVFWVLGVSVPLIGGIILARICNQASAISTPKHPSPVTGALAGILYFVTSTTIGAMPYEVLLPGLLAMPLPFLIVQHEINAGWRGEPVLPLRRQFSAARIAILVIGLPAIAVLVYVTDLQVVRGLASPSLDPGEEVAIEGSRAVLVVPGDSWRQVAPGTNGDEDAALELVHLGATGWTVVYVDEASESGFDTWVDARLALLDELGTILHREETRFYLEGGRHPASLATYHSTSLGFPEWTSVLTVRLDDQVIEVIAQTSDEKLADDVRSMAAGMRVDRGDAP